ncbi:GBS Bsp-like repeat-containing protein [Eubacterium callanderi]|uniref:GBS Bsp-like repeat-containing protein n=1 Tax=Eubacterium callanderi TaxID=53442 RepID=UPI0011DCC48C|nr:GBS Bsp-like repeat-containing protein [Eubacterium callanderi]MCC3401034.1 hypothetical protein [Eubacterium callanderi]
MQREKAKKNQIVVAMSILLLFLFSFIISGFPVYARSPVVVIQPGHSVGYDPGATNSSTGITEAAVNAAVAGKVATKLKQLGYTVYLTHPVAGCSVQSLLTNAEANSLSNVANAINKIKPDLAISVHHNSGGSSASGYEFYWSSYRDFDQEGVYEVSGLWAGDTAFRDSSPCWAAQESKVFASVLERNFNGIGINHRKTVERDDYVQAHVTCPSVLIEGGFISNPSESLLLASDAFQEKMSGRIVNSVSEYFGGATKDEKAPTADSITTPESPTTNAVFTVTANGVKDDLSGVRDVRVAIWSFENGQDDLRWYPAQNDGQGNWSAKINIKDHNNEVGYYAAHFYATDNTGNDGFLGGVNVFVTVDGNIPKGMSSKILSSNQFKAYLKGYENYSDILFPVWSADNGQDDLVWYSGIRQTDGSYAVVINNKDHGYDVGKYYVHSYGTDSNGKQVLLGTTEVNVPQMTAGSVEASEVKDGQFTVSVKNLNAPSGIKEILIPVWSANNAQDDLIWHAAQRQSDGSYKATVSLKDHGYDVGKYYIHSYGTDSNGKQVLLGTTEVNVTNNDVPDITEIEFSTSTSIMGIQTNTAQELADYFNSKAAFPSSFYGMPAVEFANIYIEECKTEGVRPEVAFAQMCLETGYLQYGGDVKREQFNFAGIGATGNGAPGNSFADVRTGIRAQVQHLKAYASTEGLVNECVDPRYQYVNKGCAPTVGDLAGKWAADVNYGNKLVTVMNAF